jgi:hypothetical protein
MSLPVQIMGAAAKQARNALNSASQAAEVEVAHSVAQLGSPALLGHEAMRAQTRAQSCGIELPDEEGSSLLLPVFSGPWTGAGSVPKG